MPPGHHEARINHEDVAKEADVRGVAPRLRARGTLAREYRGRCVTTPYPAQRRVPYARSA